MRSGAQPGGVAYICSYECTYCANCAEENLGEDPSLAVRFVSSFTRF
jgi:hypothetical protein